jgi:hypothetical protein
MGSERAGSDVARHVPIKHKISKKDFVDSNKLYTFATIIELKRSVCLY